MAAVLKTHWASEQNTETIKITTCGHSLRGLHIVNDYDALTCKPCRRKRGLLDLGLPTQKQLAAWERDPGMAFDYDAIRSLLAQIKADCFLVLQMEAALIQLRGDVEQHNRQP